MESPRSPGQRWHLQRLRRFEAWPVRWRLRPTSDGWRVLGQWPPANEADMGTAIVEILRGLAEEAGAEEAKPLRRAAGSVARFGGRVVFGVAKGEIRRTGGDLTL